MSSDEQSEVLDNTAQRLRIHLFGGPELQIAGAAWSLSDHKAQALLYYLAATGRSHTRDHLATLLWSDSPESSARHSFRSSLHHLRQALDERGLTDLLSVERGQALLRLRADACDVTRFRLLIATETELALAEAITLYRGSLLEGFTVTNAQAFEDWRRSEATVLSQAHLNALDRLIALAETRQAWGKAIEYAQQRLRMDSLDEEAQQRLIHLYVQSGAPGRALRQYQLFETELKRELGLRPSPETQGLIRQALRTRRLRASTTSATLPSSPHASPGGAPAGGAFAMPLVGRDDVLARLLTLGAGPHGGQGVTVLLHGDAGMGKTRLLGELATRLAEQDPLWIALHGSCSPFDDLLSYGPFYDALQSAATGDLTDLLAVEQGTPHREAGAIMWRILGVLRLLTKAGPLLLTLDDLHWANSATLRLFGFLATHIRSLPVFLIGTIQRPDAIPAVQRLLVVGRPRGEVHLVSVTPLGLEAITVLVHALGLGTDAVASLAEWLQKRSGGSPFILGESLAQLRADAIVTQDGPHWRLDAVRWLRQRGSFMLPETTHDLMVWRLTPLAPEALRLLEGLAVVGQPLPFGLLCDLSGIPADQALQIVDDLLARGLLIEVSGDTFALPHHLLRETLVSRLSHLRHRATHRQLLALIERCPALETHFRLRQMALHAIASEDIDRARRYGLQALDEFLHDEPNAETLAFLHHLYDLLALTASPSELLQLTHALGHLHQALGQIQAATHWRRQQLDLARTVGDLEAQIAAYFDMGELALVTNDYQAVAATANVGLGLYALLTEPHDAALAGKGYWLLGASQAMEGSDLLAAERSLQQAAATHRQVGSSSDLCADLFELGNVAAQRGELARALLFYDEARSAAEAGQVPYFLALAQNNFAYHSLLLGQVKAAQQAALQGQQVAEAYELVGAILHLSSTQGEIHLYLAEWELAAQSFQRGLVLAEEFGNRERQAGYRAGLALAARGQHDFVGATALLKEARTLIAEQGYWHLHTRILLWLAETLLLRKRVDEAWPPLEEALATARSQNRLLLLLQGQRLRARLLAAGGQWSEASALFASALQQSISLDLILEGARTQAAWGQALLRFTPVSREGDTLLKAAHATFAAQRAHADLQAISGASRQE